ncbi:MAG: hypothetical protein JST01_12720 [Cyanobacteria bacterium SZAS TMP-1]|nr:hypothetical protein [Cyanobacteria bacterium SZAS TMP-1]
MKVLAQFLLFIFLALPMSVQAKTSLQETKLGKGREVPVETMRKQAISLLKQQKPGEAIILLTKALVINPDDPTTIDIRVDAYAEAGRARQALADLDALIKLKPTASDYLRRANFKLVLTDRDGAIADDSLAIQLDPQFTAARMDRANNFFNRGSYEAAIADYSAVIQIQSSGNVEPYLYRGQAYRNLDNLNAAWSDFDFVVRQDSQYPLGYLLRGRLSSERGEHTKALADFDKAIALLPAFAKSYYVDLAQIYAERGAEREALRDFTGAIEDYNLALKMHPANSSYLVSRGLVKSYSHDDKGAIGDFDKALEISKNAIATHFFRSTSRLLVGDFRGTADDLMAVVALTLTGKDASSSERAFVLLFFATSFTFFGYCFISPLISVHK